MFCARHDGSLGLFHLRPIYYAKKLSFMPSVLHSDDEQITHTAKASFTLHFNKLKYSAAPDNDTDLNLSDYKTDAKYRLMKASKVIWRRSPWIHLNDLCSRLRIQLHLNEDLKYVL